MSDAAVQFLTIVGDPCPPGATPQRFTFRCPLRNRGRHPKLEPITCGNLLIAGAGHGVPRDPQGQNGGRPQWDFDGNREAPTFRPSVNCGGCWHGYIRAGRCVDTSGVDEP